MKTCDTCGRLTQLGSPTCDGCWEVESRLVDYLRGGGANARQRIVDAMRRLDPSEQRRRVYLESSFHADTPEGLQKNAEYLRRCMLDSMARNEAPFASHMFYVQFLDDRVPAERETGIACGLAWGALAEVTVVYEDLGISTGMRRGIDDAQARGRPVEHRKIGDST
jgi:hypothetical protein